MEKSAKEKILEVLKKSGRISTTRIAGTIGIDYNYASKLLEELEKENKIIKEEETNAIYWKLKGGLK